MKYKASLICFNHMSKPTVTKNNMLSIYHRLLNLLLIRCRIPNKMDILNSVNRNHNPGFVRHTITSSIVNDAHELDKKYLLTNNVHVSKGSMSERNLLFTNKYPP